MFELSYNLNTFTNVYYGNHMDKIMIVLYWTKPWNWHNELQKLKKNIIHDIVVPVGPHYLAPGGGCEVLFSPCLSVCLSVCPANILVFYFSAIRRDIDLKFIQDTYRVVPNSLKNIDLHRVKVNVTGTVHCFLKVQAYHTNWNIEKFQYFFLDTS